MCKEKEGGWAEESRTRGEFEMYIWAVCFVGALHPKSHSGFLEGVDSEDQSFLFSFI